jgi:hypothetical protein
MITNTCSTVGWNEAIGDHHELCAWQPKRGVVWIQTRDPRHAKRLARRSDGRLLARSVGGSYLMTFEFAKLLAWAERLRKRYTADVKVTNEGLGSAICLIGGRETALGLARGRIAGRSGVSA